MDTAINIGMSCRVVENDTVLLRVTDLSSQRSVDRALKRHIKKQLQVYVRTFSEVQIHVSARSQRHLIRSRNEL